MTQEKAVWVVRVLGVQIETDASAQDVEDAAELDERLADARVRTQILTRAKAPDAAELNEQLLAVTKLVTARDATASEVLLELEEALFAAEAAGRAQNLPSELRVPLSLRKLMIDWRAAQQAADTGIKAIGDAYLADPEVQADPRFDEVLATVRELPTLIPQFGTELSDAVDAVFNDGAKTKSVVASGLKVVQTYRSAIASAPILADLEELAREDLGGDFPISAPLLETLGKIETELQAIA